MKRETRLWVKGGDGSACGPFRWTNIREWVAAGFFTGNDEVRMSESGDWIRIGTMTELLVVPPGDEINDGLNTLIYQAREKTPVGPRAAGYLKRLGCPVRPERLNPKSALHWVRLLEELRPALADQTERWAAEEESKGRVPAATPEHATAAQVAALRSLGREPPANLTWLQARRLISGPPTASQLRRLDFYGLTLPEGACKEEATELIDRHMRSNWAAEEAYRAARLDSAPAGADVQPAPMPIGEPRRHSGAASGPAVAATGGATVASRRQRPKTAIYVIGLLVVAMGVAVTMTNQADEKSPDRVASPAAPAETPALVTILEAPNDRVGEHLRAFTASLRITGFMGGTEPRVLIDGRAYRVGDVVDESRRVTVVQVDFDGKTVVLADASGSIVKRVLK